MRGGSALDALFSQRVARFICYNFATRKYDQTRAKIFVDQFGVSIKNVRSWAMGEDCPPPLKKQEIEQFLDSWKEQT